jgi:fatty acid kinase fatty acid binding subunit
MELTAENTAIVLDSTADYPEGPSVYPNWRIVPLYVLFGGESHRDYADLGPAEFYTRLAGSSELPRTSQPSPADFAAVYEELAPSYERVLSLQLSATLSGTFGSAQAAAEGFGGAVRVIDTRTVSAAIALLAFAVQRRLERGTTDEEVDALVARFRREHELLFTLDTLDYLARGGRIGRASAFAGSLLNVKPILTVRGGEVVPLKRVRGSQKAFAEFGALLEAGSKDAPSLRIGLVHAAAPERLAALEEIVARVRPQAQVEVATALGAVVGTHAGPGTVGLLWFDDPDA